MNTNRAYRGGGWRNGTADGCTGYRFRYSPDFSSSSLEFRCYRIIEPGLGRVFRGGRWGFGATYCHAAVRGDNGPSDRSDLGFRCWRRE